MSTTASTTEDFRQPNHPGWLRSEVSMVEEVVIGGICLGTI